MVQNFLTCKICGLYTHHPRNQHNEMARISFWGKHLRFSRLEAPSIFMYVCQNIFSNNIKIKYVQYLTNYEYEKCENLDKLTNNSRYHKTDEIYVQRPLLWPIWLKKTLQSALSKKNLIFFRFVGSIIARNLRMKKNEIRYSMDAIGKTS